MRILLGFGGPLSLSLTFTSMTTKNEPRPQPLLPDWGRWSNKSGFDVSQFIIFFSLKKCTPLYGTIGCFHNTIEIEMIIIRTRDATKCLVPRIRFWLPSCSHYRPRRRIVSHFTTRRRWEEWLKQGIPLLHQSFFPQDLCHLLAKILVASKGQEHLLK